MLALTAKGASKFTYLSVGKDLYVRDRLIEYGLTVTTKKKHSWGDNYNYLIEVSL